MKTETKNKVDEMIGAIECWLRKHDYHYVECNYVPPRLFTKNRKANLALRTLYRLLPFNLRSKSDIAQAPLTPQANVAMLKAFTAGGDHATVKFLADRVLTHLKSPKTKDFSLRQGIKIALNLYEDSADDPTPLNTVWFGEFLLEDSHLNPEFRRATVLSICRYLVNELGYRDYGDDGIYFYYGHKLRDLIYNASAVISSFLIKCGMRYDEPEYVELGRRGLEFIVASQNTDGSWFYYGPPLKKAIDGFHQSYMLKSLIEASRLGVEGLDDAIRKGIDYYYTQFETSGSHLIPQRYDHRFNPKNTWLVQKVDGRDVSEAIVFFTTYERDQRRVEQLVNFMYDRLFLRKHGRMAPEIFIYGLNRNDYIEFYAWYLGALYGVRNEFFRS